VAHSSSGPGHRPLKAEIRGSNPLCATNPIKPATGLPDHIDGSEGYCYTEATFRDKKIDSYKVDPLF
jgi:hypothetical protein